MFCIYCGAKIDDDSNYCTVCGKKTNIEPENAIVSDEDIAQSTQNDKRDSEKTTVQNTEENGGNKKLSLISRLFLKGSGGFFAYTIVFFLTDSTILGLFAAVSVGFWLDRVL